MENPEPERAVYDSIASSYARRVDTAPYNALYERPAMLALLPPVAGCHVLDAGCGSGWYAEQLLTRGARVTALDASAAMLAHARTRVGDRASLHVADLTQPLTFIADASVHLVIAPLVLHYLADWRTPLAEFRRALLPGGSLLFSTHHPCTEAERLGAEHYFETEPVEENLGGSDEPVRFFRRPLTGIFQALASAGFIIDRVLEPQPQRQMQATAPATYQLLMRRPAFILIRAVAGGTPVAA